MRDRIVAIEMGIDHQENCDGSQKLGIRKCHRVCKLSSKTFLVFALVIPALSA